MLVVDFGTNDRKGIVSQIFLYGLRLKNLYIRYFFCGKKVSKKANAKKAFLLIFFSKISAKPLLQADVFASQKATALVITRLVGSPQHTLVLASHSETMNFGLNFGD